MIFSSFKNATPATQAPASEAAALFSGYDYTRGNTYYTSAKQTVNAETAKTIATAYRCKNIIGDDVAKMPFQMFVRNGKNVDHVSPDALLRNMAYLLEIQPNRWMTPFVFKKTVMGWLLFWGNSYIWEPPQRFRELFILSSSVTIPKLNKKGDLYYETSFPNGKRDEIPAVEITHLMINSTNGRNGRSVLEYARETFGRQLATKDTQSQVQGNGLKAAAYIQVNSALDKDGRDRVRRAYQESLEDAGGLAVFDNKIAKFETIQMKLTDAQFIEGIQANDVDVINFFGVPAYKLNMGKEAYNSNAQQDLDYLKSTLDPYLVQWEQAARLKWLSQAEQPNNYFKFIRESLLRTDAKTRAELHEVKIRSGQMSPNEAREVEDVSGYALGDDYYMTSNNQKIGAPVNVPA
jgi:HK97 family phage portal protein